MIISILIYKKIQKHKCPIKYAKKERRTCVGKWTNDRVARAKDANLDQRQRNCKTLV